MKNCPSSVLTLLPVSSWVKAAARIALGFVVASVASYALADPCKAIPDKGPLPTHLSRGASFSGPVVYVGDGDSLCVAVGKEPQAWVEVRLADFYAPELHSPEGRDAKAVLERIAIGKRVTCVAGRRSYDRIVAACEIDGVSLAARLRRAGVAEGGRGHH